MARYKKSYVSSMTTPTPKTRLPPTASYRRKRASESLGTKECENEGRELSQDKEREEEVQEDEREDEENTYEKSDEDEREEENTNEQSDENERKDEENTDETEDEESDRGEGEDEDKENEEEEIVQEEISDDSEKWYNDLGMEGPFGGGPESNTLLKWFKYHVGVKIWRGEERGPLKMIHHVVNLEKWKIDAETDRFKKVVSESGLSSLLFSYKNINKVLISAFVERWHPETNTFHLPFGEMSISLDDVKQLVNIPVEGMDCVGKENIKFEEAIELAQECFGLVIPKNVIETELKRKQNGGNKVRLSWLMQHLSGVGVKNTKKQTTDEMVDCAARGYLLFLLGCTLFVNKTGSMISVALLTMLAKLEDVKKYVWGVAGLAYLFRHLGKASRRKVSQIGGYLTLLEAWVYEQFMFLRPTPNLDYIEDGMPRMRRWQVKTISGDTTMALVMLREDLNNLLASSVFWDPYKDVRQHHAFPEITYFSGCLSYFDTTESYHPDRILRQFGRVQVTPYQPHKPHRDSRHASGVNYNVKFTENEVLYSTRWWNHLLAKRERSSEVANLWDCVDGYMEWFNKVSHPRIQNPQYCSGAHRVMPIVDMDLQTRADKTLKILREILDASDPHDRQTLLVKEAYTTLISDGGNDDKWLAEYEAQTQIQTRNKSNAREIRGNRNKRKKSN